MEKQRNFIVYLLPKKEKWEVQRIKSPGLLLNERKKHVQINGQQCYNDFYMKFLNIKKEMTLLRGSISTQTTSTYVYADF